MFFLRSFIGSLEYLGRYMQNDLETRETATSRVYQTLQLMPQI